MDNPKVGIVRAQGRGRGVRVNCIIRSIDPNRNNTTSTGNHHITMIFSPQL